MFVEHIFPTEMECLTAPAYPRGPVSEEVSQPVSTPYDLPNNARSDESSMPDVQELMKMGADFAVAVDAFIGGWSVWLDAAEKGVDSALSAKGYQVIRKTFKKDLPYGCIGKGSFGLVYLATGPNGPVPQYAVKLISKVSAISRMVTQEIGIMQSLSHKSVVNYVDTIQPADPRLDQVFIVMEFTAGGDLHGRLVGQPQCFTENLCRALMFHICCALAYAHSLGFVHRDMKPENILLTNKGFPKISDFGLARNLDDGNANTTVGTPAYLAPEIRSRTPYSFPVDAFSVGRILQDMLSKQCVIEWVLNMVPAAQRPSLMKKWPPNSNKPIFSEDLANLRKRLTENDPKKRPPFYAVCKELEKYGRATPKYPHPFWDLPYINTTLPRGPPNSQLPNAVAHVRKQGFNEGVTVQVNTQGGWRKGEIVYISPGDEPGGAAVPGAVTVKYKDQVGNEMKVPILPNMVDKKLRLAKGKGSSKGLGKGKKVCCPML